MAADRRCAVVERSGTPAAAAGGRAVRGMRARSAGRAALVLFEGARKAAAPYAPAGALGVKQSGRPFRTALETQERCGSVAWAKVTGSQRRCLRNRPRRTFAYDTDADYPSGSLRAYSRPHRRSSRKRNAKLTYSKTVNAYAGICRGRWARRPHVAPERWSTSPRLPNPRRKQGRPRSSARYSLRQYDRERFRELQRARASKVNPDSERQRRPWEALGVSRRTYYRRKFGTIAITGSAPAAAE